ncbi:E3 ubiquitin-protein ligase TRIM33 [Athalia rosae]|uniref:E3 ubiquitin-protein ligase TRIM33 n=1 Tax=Athalia rosae TaxID=37344 RepID=UPI0020333472|nr:E3 ubiquitin-protein ligase TRIM33 [Athalia rosae]
MEQQSSEIPVTDVVPVLVKVEPVDQNSSTQEPLPIVAQPSSNEEYVEPRIECTTETLESEFRTLLTKCVFCSKTFTVADSSKLLECLHAACASCIRGKLNDHNFADVEVVLESNVIVCQVCNVACRVENLIENRFFLKSVDDENACGTDDLSDGMKEGEEERKCTSCHDNATATSWCVECEEFICENCVLAHQRLKITKDHTIKPKGELANEEEYTKKITKKLPGYLFCSVHSHEQLSLFCQTCDRLTCRDCQLSDHRDHKYKFIHEIAAETRTSMSTLLKEVSYKRVLLKSAMKVIEDRQTLILEKKKSLVQDITHMVVQLTNAINTRGKQLVLRLNEVCDQKQNTLNEKKVALDQLSKLTDHCIQFVNHALDKGSDMALLYSKKSVINHLQRIKTRRADIPNPEIPVRIHLSLDKVPDLIKVVSSIGAIVVDGRVYPSISPTSGPLPLSNQFNEPNVEQKSHHPNNPSHSEQSVLPSHGPSPTQHASIPPNPYQQMPHPLAQQQSIPNYMHYNHHNHPPRSSPQTALHPPRQPYGLNPNPRLQQSLLMSQRPPGSCHQQVTSSTHPHQQLHLDQLGQNPSLRGLLAHNPPPYRPSNNHLAYRFPTNYRCPGNTSQRPLPPHTFHQQTNQALGSGVRMQQVSPTTPLTQHLNYSVHQPPAARWHIPQNLNPRPPFYPARHSTPPVTAPANDTYKITLKNPHAPNQKFTSSTNVNSDVLPLSQNLSIGQAVSSSVPKTPSPVPSHAKADDPEKSLDQFCQESVKDLMLTIAKLDSNGIVVIPEAQRNQLESIQVDSSTDEGMHSLTDNTSDNSKNTTACMTKDDPNEDWCAVCMDGGDAVLCCDKCPKVFHLYCHIPGLKTFPDESETWQCMLCTNVLDCSEDPPGEKRIPGMSARDLRVAQRIVLELYCQYEHSLPFREVVSTEIVEYHRIIKNPIALDVIRNKLKPDHPEHYTDLRQVLADIRLMFKNAFTYNPVESQVYQEARNLEEFFEKLLLKWVPMYAYDDTFLTGECEEKEDVFPPNKKYRRIISD